ncbi:MAG TPA: transcription elongation factor GreA [Candidatus Eisenbacteria bacterium]|nr:transcription elongation factor GreA [Candidatus Eisenbacteria bacterium]
MRIPKRKSEESRKYGKRADDFLTSAAVRKLQDDLRRLTDISRPRAVEDLTRARDMGDLSENAAYSEAKGRLGKIDSVIFSLKEKLKNAVLIEPGAGPGGRIRIGSTVTVAVNGKERTYAILGSQETNPTAGRISHLSPLGSALIGRKAGDEVLVKNAAGDEVAYRIIGVR